MEQLMNFTADFLSKSMANTLEAEEYYESVLINLQKEFMPNASNDTAVQKTKKQKQAIEVTVSRKDSVDGGSNNNKENVNQTNVLTDNDESTAMDSTASLNQRPVRIRRTKLDNLRLSILTGEKKIRIKKEPVDKPKAKPKVSAVVEREPAVVVTVETPVSEKRKSSNDNPEAANVSTESNKKLDDSVELIAKKPEMIELSDEETEMMPPPSLPVPKARKPRTKKASASASQPIMSTVQIKQEPVDEVLPKRSTRSKVAKKKDSVVVASKKPTEVVEATSQDEGAELFETIVPKVRNSEMANLSTVSTETSVTTAQAQPVLTSSQPVTETEKSRSRAPRTKSKKPVLDKVTKAVIPEPVAEPEVVQESSPEIVVEETEKSVAPATKRGRPKKASKNASADSVYEDAQNDPKMYSAKISVEDIHKQPSVEEVEVPAMAPPPPPPPPVQSEPEVESPNVNNETFVTTNNTPVVQAPIAPAAVASPHLDSTFNVALPQKKKNSAPHQDSIMTEDLSMAVDEDNKGVKQEPIESPPRKPTKAVRPTAASAKKAHEIFNPFVQSPVKAKVDAYERHAKESKIPITPKYVHLPKLASALSQPLPMRSRDNDTTPLKAAGYGGLLGSAVSDTTGNKLAHMKKVLGKGVLSGSGSDSARGSSSTVSSGSAKSSVRSHSAEDTKRIANALQQMAEEKKKKREEKQRLAQLNREKMEKEKKDQLDRLAKEREEKAKKFLQEKAEQAKLEKKKQAMARLAMENSQQMKIKEMQMKQKAAQADPNGYGWDLLRSEDSTDDEEKTNKLPPPPSWSRDPTRTQMANLQTAVPSNLVDTMFGLKPMSPDLREIFPDIDPKLLKRNSSMIWKTPPRFSRIERP